MKFSNELFYNLVDNDKLFQAISYPARGKELTQIRGNVDKIYELTLALAKKHKYVAPDLFLFGITALITAELRQNANNNIDKKVKDIFKELEPTILELIKRAGRKEEPIVD